MFGFGVTWLDLVTLPEKTRGQELYSMCVISSLPAVLNLVMLRAVVFLIFIKNLGWRVAEINALLHPASMTRARKLDARGVCLETPAASG